MHLALTHTFSYVWAHTAAKKSLLTIRAHCRDPDRWPPLRLPSLCAAPTYRVIAHSPAVEGNRAGRVCLANEGADAIAHGAAAAILKQDRCDGHEEAV